MKQLILSSLRLLSRLWCRTHGVEVAAGALIHGLPKVRIRRGGRIIIGSGVTINSAGWSNPLNDGRQTVLYADQGAKIILGECAGVSSSVMVAMSGIRIGSNTLIGAGCLICDSDMHEVPLASGKPAATSPIEIGSKVFIGARSTILKGVIIGDGAVVGANSVVTRDVPAGAVAAGSPARVVRRTGTGV